MTVSIKTFCFDRNDLRSKQPSIETTRIRFDRIDTTRFLLCRFDIPEVDLSETYIESTSYESSRIVKNLRRIDSSLLSRFKNEEGSCIIISRVLTSGAADQLLTNRVESSHGVDPHYRKSRSAK